MFLILYMPKLISMRGRYNDNNQYLIGLQITFLRDC